MKKYIIFSLILAIAFSHYSCSDDFLDKGLLGEVEETDFMLNENDAILATNAIYNNLRSWRYHGGFPIIDIMSDDMRKGSNPTDGIQIQAYEEFTFTPDDASVSGYYTELYQAIKRANLVLERAPGITMDENLKNRLLAEASFLRAMTYFKLGQSYGGVPLITTTNPDRKVPRATQQEVFDMVEEDLLFAIDNLPEQSEYAASDIGRATKGAARALLAKVYLFQGDFPNTEKYALEVINSGQYSLDPDYGHSFSVDGEYGPGSIFEIGAIADGFGDGGHQYGNTQGIRGTPNRGWGFGRPSWDLINFYEDGDPRRDASIIFLGDELDGTLIIGDGSTPDTTYDSSGNIVEIETYNQKVWVPEMMGREAWDFNVRVLRYADVLLMAAEALNENGNSSDALPHLNRVRERARAGNNSILPDITETEQAKLRELIYKERRAELALEQHRFYDLIRTGRAAEVLGPLGFQANKHELLPIPQSEIDLSEGVLTQNTGY